MVRRLINLNPLRSMDTLRCDSRDDVETVRLVSVTLDSVYGDGCLQLSVTGDASNDLHSYCRRRFGEANPLTSEHFQLTQACLALHVRPYDDAYPCRLMMTLSLPNHCDLPLHPQEGYPLGEHYLREWGVLPP